MSIIDDIPTRMVTDIPFEKWDTKAKSDLVEKFRESYNLAHGSNYQVTKDTFTDKDDFDFTLQDDSRNILKVQHTFAGAVAAEEYVDPKRQREMEDMLKEKLKDVKNLFLSYGFKKFLATKQETEKLAENVATFLRDFVEKQGGVEPTERLTPLFEYRYVEDRPMEILEPIREYFSHFDIYSNNSEGLILGSGGKPRAMLADNTRAAMAIGQKEEHYSNPEDIVLLIHHNFPFFEIFVPSMKAEHAGSPFKGIWTYAAWTDKLILIK